MPAVRAAISRRINSHTPGKLPSFAQRVSMGVRPGGISSITEISRSPYSVSASVRGIGVAVITSTCGDAPFFDQPFSLQHTEAMLLVHDHQAQPFKCHGLLRSARACRRRIAPRRLATRSSAAQSFVGALAPAHQQFHAITGRLENTARRKIMLRRQNFGGRHQRDLAAVLDRDRRGLERHDRFSAADVALKQCDASDRAVRDLPRSPPARVFVRPVGLNGRMRFTAERIFLRARAWRMPRRAARSCMRRKASANW